MFQALCSRRWFKREFPWIFQLQSALAKEGVEVYYPELLIQSADIWQFVYPETSPQQIPILYSDPLLKTASKYGFDEQWLLENVPTATSAIGNSTVAISRFTGLKAFEKWVSCLEDARKSFNELDRSYGPDRLLSGFYSVREVLAPDFCLFRDK